MGGPADKMLPANYSPTFTDPAFYDKLKPTLADWTKMCITLKEHLHQLVLWRCQTRNWEGSVSDKISGRQQRT
jgi:hypothetical protein